MSNLDVFDLFNRDYSRERLETMSLRDWLLAARDDKMLYARPAERMIASIGEQELKKFLGERINKLEMPREIIFKDQLPKTLIGKLSKKELREEYQAMKGKLPESSVIPVTALA